MKNNLKNRKGFTLIELMVTISIISLLSSIVFATLGNARNKAKDAAIKAGVDQFVTLLNLEYGEKGSYAALRNTWLNNLTGGTCSNAFASSNYLNQARAICTNMFNNSPDSPYSIANNVSGSYRMMFDTPDADNNYSITVFLNDGNWYCVGSNGKKGEYSPSVFNNGNPGCYNNP